MSTRVLVLGHSSTPIGIAANWDQLELPNVVDHDLVILDLSTVPDKLQDLCATEVSTLRDRLRRLVGIGKEVLVFMPRTFGPVALFARPRVGQTSLRRLEFLPCKVNVTPERGEVIRIDDESFDWFIRKLKDWKYHFSLSSQDGDSHRSNGRAIATNQESKHLAAFLTFPNNGTITVLPSPEYLSNSEVLAEYLAKRFPEEFGSPEPAWAAAIEIPGMSELSSEIAAVDVERTHLAERKEKLQRQLADLKVFRSLVYESGPPLERIVARAFRELGGSIPNKKYGEEEFILELGAAECLVEVKGVVNSASKAHVHQLMGHLNTAEADGKERKGILVVNAWRDTPSSERGTSNKPAFPDNVVKYAQRNNIALLTASELLVAIQKHMLGEVSGPDAIGQILNTAGVVKFSE